MSVRTFLDRLYDTAGALAGLCVLSVFLVVLAQVGGRELGFQVPGADNLASWFCAASAFLALAHTFQRGEMVQVGLLVERLEGVSRRWFEGAALLTGGVFSAYVCYAATLYCLQSWRSNELPQSGTLALPLWIPQSSFVIGAALLTLALLDNLVEVLRGSTPAYRRAGEANASAARGGEAI
jgi:TRAP-type C4-dicarboxylate transport system permease small subunit